MGRRQRALSDGGRHYGPYRMPFRSGGLRAEFDEHCDDFSCLLFNDANCNLNDNGSYVLDALYTPLPKLKHSLEAPALLFDANAQRLLSFGGYSDGKALKDISELRLNVKTESALRWRRDRGKHSLLKGRYRACVLQIARDRWAILGGTNQKAKAEKSCAVYSESEGVCGVADMKHKRSGLSACTDGGRGRGGNVFVV